MNEIHRYWRAGRVRKSFFMRWWWRNPIDYLRWWFRGINLDLGNEAECYGYRGNGLCYCPTGRTTRFCFTLLGSGFWGELSRDDTQRPCSCDKIMWLLFPDSHADEVEEYGLERLRSEFPGVEPIP